MRKCPSKRHSCMLWLFRPDRGDPAGLAEEKSARLGGWSCYQKRMNQVGGHSPSQPSQLLVSYVSGLSTKFCRKCSVNTWLSQDSSGKRKSFLPAQQISPYRRGLRVFTKRLKGCEAYFSAKIDVFICYVEVFIKVSIQSVLVMKLEEDQRFILCLADTRHLRTSICK